MRRRIHTRIVNPLLDGERIALPAYATDGAAALDLRACLSEAITLAPGARLLVATGIAIDMMDPGLVAIVASRSGLSLKHGVRVAQGIGVIDADYHGEIRVILANDGTEPYQIEPGERIAQLLFQPVVQVALQYVDDFTSDSARSQDGFGSTGRH